MYECYGLTHLLDKVVGTFPLWNHPLRIYRNQIREDEERDFVTFE